jgi:hypothetical protein
VGQISSNLDFLAARAVVAQHYLREAQPCWAVRKVTTVALVVRRQLHPVVVVLVLLAQMVQEELPAARVVLVLAIQLLAVHQ